MPTFAYRGIAANGKDEDGSVEASHEAQAYEVLSARGVTVYELSKGNLKQSSNVPWYLRDISLRDGKIPLDQQAIVADLLACLFASGIPATEVFRIAAQSVERKEVKIQFEKTVQHLSEGKALGVAFELENKFLSQVFSSFFQVNDTANALPSLLKELSTQLKRQSGVAKKISSALIYPAILVCAACALLLIVIFYLAPNLAPIFESVQKSPPPTIEFLLALNAFLGANWLIVSIGSVAMAFLVLMAAQSPAFVSHFHRRKYSLPLFGKLLAAAELSRLAYTTKLLLEAGQPLTEALGTASKSSGRANPIADSFESAVASLNAGGQANSAFKEVGMVPTTFKELFRVGEETNSLAQTLQASAESLNSEVEVRTQRLLVLLTPVLTLAFGLGIGFLIYTLMGAILEVNEVAF